jgi:hypothetical protein
MANDDTGFAVIFDGKSLQGWDGDPKFWRAESGAIVGETTEENPVKGGSTFLIWRGGQPADFELKVEYRVRSTSNSGIQYRSVEVPSAKWVLRGYQADASGADWSRQLFDWVGRAKGWDFEDWQHLAAVNFDEGGRQFLAMIGQLTYVGDGEKQRVLASLGESAALASVPGDGWNALHVIARGNVMIHVINGRVMSVVIDDDTANRRMSGLLGLQVHGGSPMKVAFRNIRLKTF